MKVARGGDRWANPSTSTAGRPRIRWSEFMRPRQMPRRRTRRPAIDTLRAASGHLLVRPVPQPRDGPGGARGRIQRPASRRSPRKQVAYAAGVARLRHYLNRWKLQRLQAESTPGQVDYLVDLENHYKRIFPGRSFADPEPMFRGGVPSPTDYYFMLSDGNRTYDSRRCRPGNRPSSRCS